MYSYLSNIIEHIEVANEFITIKTWFNAIQT